VKLKLLLELDEETEDLSPDEHTDSRHGSRRRSEKRLMKNSFLALASAPCVFAVVKKLTVQLVD